MLVLRAYKSKANFENVATGIKKENLLLTHSHVSPALKEVKHVARIFSTYFNNKKLKNETRTSKKCNHRIFDFLKINPIFLRNSTAFDPLQFIIICVMISSWVYIYFSPFVLIHVFLYALIYFSFRFLVLYLTLFSFIMKSDMFLTPTFFCIFMFLTYSMSFLSVTLST